MLVACYWTRFLRWEEIELPDLRNTHRHLNRKSKSTKILSRFAYQRRILLMTKSMMKMMMVQDHLMMKVDCELDHSFEQLNVRNDHLEIKPKKKQVKI